MKEGKGIHARRITYKRIEPEQFSREAPDKQEVIVYRALDKYTGQKGPITMSKEDAERAAENMTWGVVEEVKVEVKPGEKLTNIMKSWAQRST